MTMTTLLQIPPGQPRGAQRYRPFLKIPGGAADVFLAKDFFHPCHLGAVRTFAVNALCFLVAEHQFVPCMKYMFSFIFWLNHLCFSQSITLISLTLNKSFQDGNSASSQLASAYAAFAQHCKTKRLYPLVKHFTEDKTGWTSMRTGPRMFMEGFGHTFVGWVPDSPCRDKSKV